MSPGRSIKRVPSVRLPTIAKTMRIINNYDHYMNNKLSPIRQKNYERWKSENKADSQPIFTAIDFN